MLTLEFSATTDPSDVFVAPLSGEGTLSAPTMGTPADGLKLQGANASDAADAEWCDLTDVTVLAQGDEINFRTHFRYLRVTPITGAVTATKIQCSGMPV